MKFFSRDKFSNLTFIQKATTVVVYGLSALLLASILILLAVFLYANIGVKVAVG